MIKVKTDYPFRQLGDEPGKVAPTRVLEAVWYDGNKYVGVILPDGQKAELKSGYCYKTSLKGFRADPQVMYLEQASDWEAYDERIAGSYD